MRKNQDEVNSGTWTFLYPKTGPRERNRSRSGPFPTPASDHRTVSVFHGSGVDLDPLCEAPERPGLQDPRRSLWNPTTAHLIPSHICSSCSPSASRAASAVTFLWTRGDVWRAEGLGTQLSSFHVKHKLSKLKVKLLVISSFHRWFVLIYSRRHWISPTQTLVFYPRGSLIWNFVKFSLDLRSRVPTTDL